MITLGISAGFHDAAITVLDDDNIMFAAHSERYSKIKHDPNLCYGIMQEALSFCKDGPDVVAFYERPWLKKTRQLYAGQYAAALNMSDITIQSYLKNTLPDLALSDRVIYQHCSHHLSHAAAAFQTSPYSKATVVVIDAIGEWDTVSIYGAEYHLSGYATYKTLWKQRYPHSLGLFYSAITKQVGLRPLDEEYILMGMAGYGTPSFLEEMGKAVPNLETMQFSENFHCGTSDDYLVPAYLIEDEKYNIASSAQAFAEKIISAIIAKAQSFNWSNNLVYSGGVALNCSANRLLGKFFDRVWIMPNPGDAGSSLGAAAIAYGKKLDWQDPYLGTLIPGHYPVTQLVDLLLSKKIVGVASGRAEFGPRALGNRSLLADPRGNEIKDQVNEIKRRQKFRPFAPVVLEEHAHKIFELPAGFDSSPYMQVTAKCLQPDLYPAIIHVDGTSRVQTVPPSNNCGIRKLLEHWYDTTGCPLLLNTSLNIRGEPMVNDRADAFRFEQAYNVPVVS